MPSKNRWTLNPKKWFGTISNTDNKHDQNTNPITRAPPTAKTTTRTIPSLPMGKSQKKVLTISNDTQRNNTTLLTPITQFQLPAFSVRRERTSTFLPSSTFYRQNTFIPGHTEPTIRKNVRLEEELSIDTTRWNVQPIPTSIYGTTKYENPSPIKQLDISILNMSHHCLIDYPRHSPNITEQQSSSSPLPTRSFSSSCSSSSSIIDDNDNSSSSGVFTDERQRTESKDTLSTLEVLSIESIADSQTSLNHCHKRPIIHHYRRPMSVFEITDEKSQQRPTSVIPSHRSHSAEGILKDNQINSTTKSRQSSAAIIKKSEKRIPTSRSPTATLEKAGFIRITNDTYRLTGKKINNYLSYPRKNSIDTYIPNINYDDSLRSANDEECYATLPRTSSTEQLNTNMQSDLRITVDECIRPIVTSIKKNRLTKTNQNRYKRTHINNDHTQLNIENITDKLLSSIDYSIYTRYQRCN